MTKRMKPADRKGLILEAAIKAAQRHGYHEFRLVHVAHFAGCSTASVMHYFSTMEQVRRAVMREAIRSETLNVIAAGIALGDKHCRKISDDLRNRAVQSLVS